MRCRSAVLACLLVALAATTARAQDTADAAPDANAEEQREPGAGTGDTGFAAKVRQWAEDKRIVERIAPREGFYVRFGGMVTDSGLALGPGYRRYFGADEDLFADVSVALSTKVYKALDAKARWARFWGNRVELWSEFLYRDYPEEDFFGIGARSSLSNRVAYSIESTDIAGRAVVHLQRWLRAGADIGYFNPDVGHSADDSSPSIEELFLDPSAPGLARQPEFLHHSLFTEVDYRDRPGIPTRGGFYRAAFSRWEDVSLEAYDHHRFDAEASQFFPVKPKQTVAAHVGLSYVNNEAGHRVPFYFLPYAGGSDTVRGYREFRFRDENLLFFNLEYRLQLLPFFQVAPFVDAGEVREDWGQIGLSGLRTSYGIGFRAGIDDHVFLRIDVGTGGGEGTRVFFKFGPAF